MGKRRNRQKPATLKVVEETRAVANAPDPEVLEKPTRRSFTAEYKKHIIEQADACSEPGELGELLRREGLYSSHLSSWRKAGRAGELSGLTPRKRGPGKKPDAVSAREHEKLKRENARLERELEKAQLIIEVQKKLAAALGLTPDLPERKK